VQTPPTNMDMYRAIQKARAERMARYQRDGYCCEEGPWADGICRHGLGRCFLVTEARQIQRKGTQ